MLDRRYALLAREIRTIDMRKTVLPSGEGEKHAPFVKPA
jgi:hypothetical protein